MTRLQFDAEFRRWSLKRSEQHSFDEFQSLLERLHKLDRSQLLVSYIDPRDNDLLPINNDDNFGRALTTARPLLRVIIQRKGRPSSIIELVQSLVCRWNSTLSGISHLARLSHTF